jgi:hypothetical protein
VAVVCLVRFAVFVAALWLALVAVLDVAAVGDRSRVVSRGDDAVGFVAAVLVGIVLLTAVVVTLEQTLTRGALAGKGLLVVVGVGKERALFAAVTARDGLAVVHTERRGFGLVNPTVALAVVHVRAERLQRGLDAFLGRLNTVGIAVLADRKRILLGDSGAGVGH